MKILIIILVIVIFISIYFWVDFTTGRRKHRAAFKKGNYPLRHSHIEIFEHGQKLFNDYMSEVSNAKKHIHILFYIVKDDRTSQMFLELLAKKAQEGVEVRLLLDWVGSFQVSKKMIGEFKLAGGEFAFCHIPKLPYLFYTFQTRNHRKITVIDGRVGYAGGFNIGKEYIDMDPKFNPWRDYHLKLKGEGVIDLQMQFLMDWERATKIKLLSSPSYFPTLDKGPFKHHFFPTEGILLEENFSELINSARKSIFIGTPYFIPSSKILNDLIDALSRGVTITILVPFKEDHFLVKEASFHSLRQLLKKGANVYQFENGFYHAKTFIIDEEICDIGTANFDMRSLFLNYEINCFIYSKPFIDHILQVVKNDLKDAKKLKEDELDHLPFFTRVKEVITRPISYFL